MEVIHPISSTLILPTRLDHLHPLLAYTRELAEIVGFSTKEQHELELAVGEISTNIIEHGFENNSQETFQIDFEVTATKIVVRFFEKGLPFDPAALPQYSPENATDATTGLGTYLARKVVDNITFRYLGRHGKEMILTKHLQQQTMLKNTVAEPSVDKVATDLKYEIRPFQPEDGIAVARCAYRAYGYSYADIVYNPAHLIEHNNTGSLISLVAKSEADGEVLGYGDLRLYGEIAEIESVFIAPKCQGTRIFHKLALSLVEQSRSHNLLGHFCLSVTSHLIAQKAARFVGMADCGILLGYLPETTFKSMALQTQQRVSLALAFGILKDRDPVTIYPPACHQAIIEKIYVALKIPVVINDSPGDVPAPHESTVYHREIQSDLNNAIIRVTAYGPDATAIIKEQAVQCRRQAIDVVYLYLDLQNPAASTLTAEAEKIGFFFAGVLPAGLKGQDTLILQCLNAPFEWDEIKLATPFAHELLAYIHQDSDRIG